jgi:5'-nucleotidase
MRSLSQKLFVLLIVATLVLVSVGVAGAAPRNTVDIQILDVSDWHGQLDPISVTGVGNVGGAAVLSTYFKADRLANPNTLTLTAGDAVGASPALSAFFNDVPAILAMNLMGIQADTFGNHNFDAGLTRLQSQIDLADFQYVSANLKNRDDELTGVKDYEIFVVGGVKVAVIGITNPEAPGLVFPGNFGTIEPTDPISAANKAKAQALAEGAKVIIAITHLGVTGFDPVTGLAYGPLIDFANNVGGFDVIFGDHTDVQYSGIHNNALVVENRSKGVSYSKSIITVEPENGRIVNRTNTFVTPLASAVAPDPAIVAMLAPYRTQLAAVFDTKIGEATGIFVRGGNIERRQEVPIGNLIADSLRLRYGTQIALTNGGGIRAALPSSYAPLNLALRRTAAPYAIGPNYDLVIGDVFTVLPFGNSVVTRTVTGTQLWAALENGVSQINSATCLGADGRFPQISGFKFTFQCSLPAGSRVLSVSLTDGTPILPDATTYTLATNDFVNAGGDGYAVLRDGQGITREVMADVLLAYIQSLGTITPTTDGRITKLP